MNLKSQRRIAARILKAGEGRVWIDPDRIEDVDIAISRAEIRRLIHEGAIRASPLKGTSRARARLLTEKKRKGLRRGPGKKSGTKRSKVSKKQAWMKKSRALRKRLRELKNKRTITVNVYRRIYRKVGSGLFESTAELERHLKTRGLWRKR